MDKKMIKVTRTTKDLEHRAIVSDKIHLKPTIIVINSREAVVISRNKENLSVSIELGKIGDYKQLDGYSELLSEVLEQLSILEQTTLLKEGLNIVETIVESYEITGVKLSDNTFIYATNDDFFIVTEEEKIADIADIITLEEVLRWIEN